MMKKTMKLTAISALTVGVLIACSNNDEVNDPPSSEPDNEETNDESNDGSEDTSMSEEPNDEGSTEGLPEKSDFNSDDDNDNSGPNLGEGSTEDQLDLRIGDTGQIESSLNMIEVTLNSVSIEESINNETPERDNFIVADITLKNLADESMDIAEAIDVLELTGGLDGGGGPDFSHYYNAIEPMEGNLESGQEIDGQLLFEENKFDEYYIRVNEGLIAAGGAKNQAIWTFTVEETE